MTTLSDSNVFANSASNYGGGVFNDAGSTTLTSSTVSGNTASSGGGLKNVVGTLNLNYSTVSGNTAAYTAGSGFYTVNGGGVSNRSGTTTLTDCIIGGNTGGGLYNGGSSSSHLGNVTLTDCTVSGNSGYKGGGLNYYNFGTIALNDSTVSGNSAYLDGGGFFNTGPYSTATLTNCTVSNNSARFGGGVFTSGGSSSYSSGAQTTLTNCTISGNTAVGAFNGGGGIETAGESENTLIDCTIIGNSAEYGGGLFLNSGITTLTNCTITGNSASDDAGGLWGYGTPTVHDCTISGNSAGRFGGGIQTGQSYNAHHLQIGNTIVAGNTASTGPDLFGFVTSQGTNLIGKTDGSSGWVTSGADQDLTGTVALPLATKLGVLGYYGGPTETMPLLPGSPAINAGNNALIPLGVTTDQRGTGFPRILPSHSHGTVDIGAYETPNGTTSQTITFATLANKTYGVAPITLTAKASSKLPVIFAVKSGPATVSGKTLTITGAGTVVIEASQAGNTSYAPAVPVDRTFTVASEATATTVISPMNPSIPGVGVSFTAIVSMTASPGPATDGSVQFSVDGTNFGAPVPLSSTGTAASPPVFLSSGPHTVTAVYTSVTGNFSSSTGTLSGGQVVNPVTPASLGSAISMTSTPTLVAPADNDLQTINSAINALPPQTSPVTITVDLDSGPFGDPTVKPPTGVKLVLTSIKNASKSGSQPGSPWGFQSESTA